MKRTLLVLAAACMPVFSAEPITPEVRAKMMESFESSVREATALMSEPNSPREMRARSLRGDCYLFLGRPKDAITDFQRMIELNAKEDEQHWRLGIAYYFAGEYAKAAKQFEKYHAFDNSDRENGVWKFFSQVKVDGIEKARKELLTYTKFCRHPFPDLYEMLEGKKTPVDVFAAVEKNGLKDHSLVMFFAHYYVGWYEELMGHPATAKDHLAKAVALAQKAGASGGPGYMGQVARLHYERMK